MGSLMAFVVGSVMACLIGGSIAAVAYLLGRAVESRRWLLAEVIWLRKTPPGIALHERQVALAHVGKLAARVPPEHLGRWQEVDGEDVPHETPGPTLIELYERKREAADHVLRDCLVAGGGDEHAARRLADYVAEAPVRRAARLADGGVTMQMLDEACEAIGRLGLPREEVERRWPSRADFDRLRGMITAARPDVVAADGGRVVVADLKTASRAYDELSRALVHELAPEPRRDPPWGWLAFTAGLVAVLWLAVRCGS